MVGRYEEKNISSLLSSVHILSTDFRGLYGFIHELGHVMGASHELASKAEWPADEIPYRHAFRFPKGVPGLPRDGTIMT